MTLQVAWLLCSIVRVSLSQSQTTFDDDHDASFVVVVDDDDDDVSG